MVSTWAERPLLEGPGAGEAAIPGSFQSHVSPAPRCSTLCPSPEVQDTQSDGETQALSSGSLSLGEGQDTGFASQWPVIIFLTNPS